jgi:hypothetical protein
MVCLPRSLSSAASLEMSQGWRCSRSHIFVPPFPYILILSRPSLPAERSAPLRHPHLPRTPCRRRRPHALSSESRRPTSAWPKPRASRRGCSSMPPAHRPSSQCSLCHYSNDWPDHRAGRTHGAVGRVSDSVTGATLGFVSKNANSVGQLQSQSLAHVPVIDSGELSAPQVDVTEAVTS